MHAHIGRFSPCLPLIAALALCPASSRAETAEEFEAKLGWQRGDVKVGDAAATLHFADGFRYLDPGEARRVLVDAWGNPPETAENVLGMIFPAEARPTQPDGWGVVVTYEKQGYVSDDGAEKMDFDQMLKEMQQAAAKANEERKSKGFEAVEVVGWAEAPHYDKANHKLYWAKRLRFGDAKEDTLNYNIRVLGRHGVLVLNAVAGMSQLESIKNGMGALLPRVEFNEGHRYADFIPGKDKVAEYGIVALIAGGAALAAKGGLVKWLVAGALMFKKFWIVGVAGGAAALRKRFSRRSESPTATPPGLG